MNESYEFDPCSIDGSDNELSLDDWRPTVRVEKLPKSAWRQQQNAGNYKQNPGIDDLKKITMYLKKKYPDHEIMDAFGITSETLVAIKRNCYSPVNGIALDNQSKIYKEFSAIEKKLDRIFEALKFIADNVFDEKDSYKCMALKAIIRNSKKNKKNTPEDEEE